MATTTKTVFLTDENGNLLVDSNGRPRALTFTVVEGKSLRLAERETIPTVTYAELKTYSESVQTYTGITNAAKFSVEDVAVFQYIVSDRGNTRAYITAQVSAVNDTSLTANGIGISVAGADGEKGGDGVTPHIGDNKHWYIGEEDTGIVAEGKDGATPEIGENGNWYINGEDTGKPSKGAKGADGKSVTSATAGTVSEADGYTVTPVTFGLSDGSSLPSVEVKAKNGEVEVIDLGEQEVGVSFSITSEQSEKVVSDNPPFIKVTITNMFGAFIYKFVLSRIALRGGYAYYGGAYIDDRNTKTLYEVGVNIHSTSAVFEVHELSESGGIIDFGEQSRHKTFDVTTEQMNKMLSDTPPLVKFTISDIDKYKSYTFTLERTAKYANRALYGGCYYEGDISIFVGFDAHGTTAGIEVYDDVIGGSGGTPVINLGEVTLMEQSLGGISMAMAGNITVSAEQATLAQADNPPVVKIRFDNADHEFCRTELSTDPSAAYVSFTAIEETGERTKFYNLQITIPLTGGTASASLLVLKYRLVSSVINPLNLGYVTFVDGIANITLSNEQNGVIGAVNALEFTKNGTGEVYYLYRSQFKSGGASDANDIDFFCVTTTAGTPTLYAAYLNGTTLTIKQVAIGSGSSAGGGLTKTEIPITENTDFVSIYAAIKTLSEANDIVSVEYGRGAEGSVEVSAVKDGITTKYGGFVPQLMWTNKGELQICVLIIQLDEAGTPTGEMQQATILYHAPTNPILYRSGNTFEQILADLQSTISVIALSTQTPIAVYSQPKSA